MSAAPHTFLSVSKQGVAGIVETTGNQDCHVVLPPGAEAVTRACAKLDDLELPARVMVSGCHVEGQSISRLPRHRERMSTEYPLGAVRVPSDCHLTALCLPSARLQVSCSNAAEVAAVAAGVSAGGKQRVFGVMLPSFLLAGAQPLQPGDPHRKYGPPRCR